MAFFVKFNINSTTPNIKRQSPSNKHIVFIGCPIFVDHEKAFKTQPMTISRIEINILFRFLFTILI